MGKKQNVFGAEWPVNLITALGMLNDDPLERRIDESELLLAMNFGLLTDREKQVILMRFYDQKTLEECGEVIGTQRERVRQVEAKALRKLRHPKCSYILVHGAKAYMDKRIEEAIDGRLECRRKELEAEYMRKVAELSRENSEALLQNQINELTIDELGLSVRAYNCLTRAGLNTVGAMLTKCRTAEQAMKIRNLGRKSLEEVSAVLKRDYGIKWPING